MDNIKIEKQNLLHCGYCGKVLTNKTEIEYSRWLCEFYCNPDCAMSRYFEYCGSTPFDEESYDDYGIKVLPDGRLYKKQ
jgi:hypothetical protein